MPHVQPVQVLSAVQEGTNMVVHFQQSLWRYSIVNLYVQGPTGSRASLYVGAIGQTFLRDSTPYGQDNTATYPAGQIIVNPGTEVLVVWNKLGSALAAMTVTEDF